MLLFHRCKGRCLLALFLVGWALSSHAQPSLTADQAVQLATSQPHVRDALEAGVERARSDVLAARTWENPTLELEQEREDSAAGAPARETSVLLSQPLELGGRRGLRRDAAEQGVMAAEVAADHERARLRADVLREYYAAVAAERRGRSQQRMAQGLEALATTAGQRRAAGDLSGYESRRIAQAHAQAHELVGARPVRVAAPVQGIDAEPQGDGHRQDRGRHQHDAALQPGHAHHGQHACAADGLAERGAGEHQGALEHRHPRREKGSRGHCSPDRRLRLPHPSPGRCRAGCHHPRNGLWNDQGTRVHHR